CPSDGDSSSSSSHHHHNLRRLDGITGCPSVHEIVSALGLDLKPNDVVFVAEFDGPVVLVVQNRDEVYEQVVEVAKRKRNLNWSRCGDVENEFRFNDCSNEVDDLLLFQQTSFTSLLNFSFEFDVGAKKNHNNDYGTEAEVLLWNRNPTYQPPQLLCVLLVATMKNPMEKSFDSVSFMPPLNLMLEVVLVVHISSIFQ
ncbi:zinc finger protein CONSTANS-like 15-like, partial [Trifolium medium]|nr:zinc finger protein CONSTANS-like 15-like [Trifolium medium]